MFKISSLVLLLAAFLFLFTNHTEASNMKDDSKDKNPQYIISVKQGNTVFGDILIELFPDVAPKHVHNFDSLVSVKAFDGTAFHRVVPGFVIQGGDPNSKNKPKDTWGYGDPSQKTVPAEFNKLKHERGIISAARSQDPNSATSQFFICLDNISHLDGKYTVYGKVLTGLDIVDKIVAVPCDGQAPKEKVEMTIKKK